MLFHPGLGRRLAPIARTESVPPREERKVCFSDDDGNDEHRHPPHRAGFGRVAAQRRPPDFARRGRLRGRAKHRVARWGAAESPGRRHCQRAYGRALSGLLGFDLRLGQFLEARRAGDVQSTSNLPTCAS